MNFPTKHCSYDNKYYKEVIKSISFTTVSYPVHSSDPGICFLNISGPKIQLAAESIPLETINPGGKNTSSYRNYLQFSNYFF